MEKMHKLLAKKKKTGKEMTDVEAEAKMNAVKELQSAAAKGLAGKLGGIKKVTVAAPSKEGLSKGLQKAQELVGDDQEEQDPNEHDNSVHAAIVDALAPGDNVSEEGHEQEDHDDEMADLSPEEIDEKLAKLMALKQKFKAQV